jgi:hypothetical protein
MPQSTHTSSQSTELQPAPTVKSRKTGTPKVRMEDIGISFIVKK